MRRLRIAAPAQLPLDLPGVARSATERWLLLPETTRVQVLAMLSRLIARGVVATEEDPDAYR